MSCDSAVYHAAKPYIIDFFHIIWYNSASIFPQVRKRMLVMKLYLKDNKLILDASGRVSLKIVAYSAMIILYISVLSELLSNALENLFEIILYSVSVVALGLYLLLSRSLLLKVTFDEKGIRETRISFIKSKFIAWDDLEDFYFMEFSMYRNEYPKFSKAIFTSKDISDKKAYQIQTPYYAGKKKEEYERIIRNFCDRFR